MLTLASSRKCSRRTARASDHPPFYLESAPPIFGPIFGPIGSFDSQALETTLFPRVFIKVYLCEVYATNFGHVHQARKEGVGAVKLKLTGLLYF